MPKKSEIVAKEQNSKNNVSRETLKGAVMERLTNSNKEIPTLDDNAEYWLKVYFKLKDYENKEEQLLNDMKKRSD